VQWPDGERQIVSGLTKRAVNTINRGAVDDTGDMNGDGILTATDHDMLFTLTVDAAMYDALYPDTPGLVTGDVDGNGLIDLDDWLAWSLLPPH